MVYRSILGRTLRPAKRGGFLCVDLVLASSFHHFLPVLMNLTAQKTIKEGSGAHDTFSHKTHKNIFTAISLLLLLSYFPSIHLQIPNSENNSKKGEAYTIPFPQNLQTYIYDHLLL
jgi:hypothetical protein